MNIDNVTTALEWLGPFLFVIAVALGALAQREMDRRARGMDGLETPERRSRMDHVPELLLEMGCYIIEVEYIPRPKIKLI